MSIRREIAFCNVLKKNFKFIRNIEILLEVNFPLLFTFNANDNKNYLAYVVDFKRRKKVLNIMYTETDDETIYELLSQQISLRKALTKYNKKTIYSYGLECIEYADPDSVLPDDDFYLTELLPNNVDIVLKKYLLQKRMEMMNNYEDATLKSNQFLDSKYLNSRIKYLEMERLNKHELIEAKIIKNYINKINYSNMCKKNLKNEMTEILEILGGIYESKHRV